MTNEELEQILVESKLISPQELERAISESHKLNRSLERIVLDMHLLNKDALFTLLAQRMGVEYLGLSTVKVSDDVLNIYPEDLARNTQSVPIQIKNNYLHIAMQDPTNVSLIDQIQLFTGYPLEVFLSAPDDIEKTINRLYRRVGETKDLFAELQKEEGKSLTESTSIVKVVDLIVSQAVRDRASDIHIEPEENTTRIRFRIDGVMHEIPPPPKDWELAIISRIKVLSGMDIAESRVPQDGHFQLEIDGRLVDFRVSTLPTIHGENLVLRLLDTGSVAIGLERLGFTTFEDLKRYEELLSKPYGIILSTGPTGCGKTTTLYSALMRINTPDRNIITLEDPVEYRLGLIRQVQINTKAGITFANGLRAILRQDPDVIMVGEIRDLETARMAIQAALTGHLVFSTLHTNDAPSAIARLIDMGVEPFLVSSSLIGVMAQRLIRMICPNCKQSYKPSKATLKKWRLMDRKDFEGFRGAGCDECKGTGFQGRSGIFELMIIDEAIQEMITANASIAEIRKKARESGMRLLWEDGREKIITGVTTFEEVGRVCEERLDPGPDNEEAKGKNTVEEVSAPAQSTETNKGKERSFASTDEQISHVRLHHESSNKDVMKPKKITSVSASDLDDYRDRIAQWLSKPR